MSVRSVTVVPRCRQCRNRIINAGLSAMAPFVKAKDMDDGPGREIGEALREIVEEPIPEKA